MKLLIITENVPYPPDSGVRIPIYYLAKEIRKQDHFVGVVSLFNNSPKDIIREALDKFKDLDVKLSIHRTSTEFIDVIRYSLKNNEYDVVVIDTSPLSKFMFVYKSLMVDMSLKIFLYPRDSLTLFLTSKFKAQTYLKRLIGMIKIFYAKQIEKKYLSSNVNGIIFVSDQDANMARSILPYNNKLKSLVSPLGVDINFFCPTNLQYKYCNQKPILLFTGIMNYGPNEDAAIKLINFVFPEIYKFYPNALLYIVGSNPTNRIIQLAKKYDGINVTGYVPDIREYYKMCYLYLCPLSYGAGMKNKVLEALSMGLPVIATSQAVSGLPPRIPGVIVSNNFKNFIENCLELISNENLVSSLSEKARSYIVNNYSWTESARIFIANLKG